jgi:hypothetical protein
MEEKINNPVSPDYIPAEYQVPFDVIEIPSQGILYKNKNKSIKVEYLTAFDETILSSPNISNSGNMTDILINRKVKDLGFDPLDLLVCDRIAILLFLRSTAFGHEYKQLVVNKLGDVVEGTIDLSSLKQKKLSINPDADGLFDFVLPTTNQIAKFRFLTGRDEAEIDELDANYIKKTNDGISNKLFFRLEKQVVSINGVTDKIKISNLLKNLSLKDSRLLRKYISEIEPGIDFDTTAGIHGGESVSCFLRFNSSFFFPEL